MATCCMCGATAPDLKRYELTGRAYCGKACSNAYRSKVSSETMARTNRKHASARMKSNNPMAKPEAREKMTASLRASGHKPRVRGGNGKPATPAEQMLIAHFGPLGFSAQCSVRTLHLRHTYKAPPAYKVDCGNPALKLAIEADGNSHQSLLGQDRDARKTACLNGLGWTLLRFSNQQILHETEHVIGTVLSTISRLKGCTPT